MSVGGKWVCIDANWVGQMSVVGGNWVGQTSVVVYPRVTVRKAGTVKVHRTEL